MNDPNYLFYPPTENCRGGRPLNRRRFLKINLQTAWGLLLVSAGFRCTVGAAAAGPPDIGVATGGPAVATRAAIELLGGMQQFVKAGDRVVIKPNMSFAGGPENATNTHPEVVRELVALCKAAGAGRVRVLDHPLRRNELCIEGVKSACEVFEEDMVHGLTRSRFYKPVDIPGAAEMQHTDVMQDVLEADVLIAAPVAKSHGSTGVSLAMKGMMGLVWDRGIMHSRFHLHTAIVDLASLLRPHLTVIDATRVLSTNGPSGPGEVIQAKTVIASADMVAADALAVEMFPWYGRKMAARQVAHIRQAHERGLGRMDVENLTIRRADS